MPLRALFLVAHAQSRFSHDTAHIMCVEFSIIEEEFFEHSKFKGVIQFTL